MRTFRLCQVTDPHFRDLSARALSGLSFGDLWGKRLVGGVNLVLVRRRKHRMDILRAMGQALKSLPFDHLAVTGDLTNISLPAELAAARAWIESLGRKPEDISVIPGNHDAYVPSFVRSGHFEKVMAPWQSSDSPASDSVYPFVRIRDTVAIMGVSSCVATGDLGAWGMIGADQLARLESELKAHQGKTRVVLLHHPPVVHRGGNSRNLRDREALAAVLARVGAELVLHGHDHRALRADLKGPGDVSIPVVGAPSASYGGAGHHAGGFALHELSGRRVVTTFHIYDAGQGAFVPDTGSS